MLTKYKKHQRIIWGLFTAILAFAFVTLMGQQSLSSNELSDAAKHQKVESLYDGYKTNFPAVLDLTPRQAMNLIVDQKAVFIDTREPEEQQVSMLPGAITEKEFLSNYKSYEDHVKIAYCTISYRSGIFVENFQKRGIPVYNLRGGILAWVHAGGKVYDQTGETYRIHVYGQDWNLAPEQYEAVW
jgi:rhodanese-related sulfurtransferase